MCSIALLVGQRAFSMRKADVNLSCLTKMSSACFDTFCYNAQTSFLVLCQLLLFNSEDFPSQQLHTLHRHHLFIQPWQGNACLSILDPNWSLCYWHCPGTSCMPGQRRVLIFICQNTEIGTNKESDCMSILFSHFFAWVVSFFSCLCEREISNVCYFNYHFYLSAYLLAY